MTKNEAKTWVKNKIDNSDVIKEDFWLLFHYNEQYIRALKFSKIIDRSPVINNFKNEKIIFQIDLELNYFHVSIEIYNHLILNYNSKLDKIYLLFFEVLDEYSEYKELIVNIRT